MTKRLFTKDEADVIKRLVKQGHTFYEIGKIVNRHACTIKRWYKRKEAETFFNVHERENWAI